MGSSAVITSLTYLLTKRSPDCALGVDTRNWLPGKKVLVSPRWVSEVSWNRREVYTDLESSEIKSAPEWDPDAPIDHEYEIRLHEHYGRPPYWLYH